MPVERILDPQAVEAAEFARKNNKVLVAAEMAAIGMGLKSSPLTSEEVSEIAHDPEQRAVLVCLARIQVDSLKTLANQARVPWQALPPLEKAVGTINLVHRNPEMNSRLESFHYDHRGRRHDFWAEMKRDEAKTLFASSILYGPSDSNKLMTLGETVLRRAYIALPDDHPTKPLIGIEMELSRASSSVKPDMKLLRTDFAKLKKTTQSRMIIE